MNSKSKIISSFLIFIGIIFTLNNVSALSLGIPTLNNEKHNDINTYEKISISINKALIKNTSKEIDIIINEVGGVLSSKVSEPEEYFSYKFKIKKNKVSELKNKINNTSPSKAISIHEYHTNTMESTDTENVGVLITIEKVNVWKHIDNYLFFDINWLLFILLGYIIYLIFKK
jgi:hypothetical protein